MSKQTLTLEGTLDGNEIKIVVERSTNWNGLWRDIIIDKMEPFDNNQIRRHALGFARVVSQTIETEGLPFEIGDQKGGSTSEEYWTAFNAYMSMDFGDGSLVSEWLELVVDVDSEQNNRRFLPKEKMSKKDRKN